MLPKALTPSAQAPLALYIHWPFCVVKCPYCDFNSHVRAGIDEAAWLAALKTDMAYEAARTGSRRLTSLFFGGGTPSLMPPALVAALIEQAEALWGFAEDVEITLEANPNSVEVERFAALRHAGVNRISLGIQALEDDALRFLGRAHNAGEALVAIETAQAHFHRINLDFIYALPEQSLSDWQALLPRILAFGTEHLSLYQLTIEPGTRFASDVAKGRLVPLDVEAQARMFEHTASATAAAGLPAYEISNHARAGAASRHNLNYWRYGDYIGIGPGGHGRRTDSEAAHGRRTDGDAAHGRRTDIEAAHGRRAGGDDAHGLPSGNGKHATMRHKKPENYLQAIAAHGHGIVEETALTVQEQAQEALLMGLRVTDGIDLERLSALLRMPPAQLINHEKALLLQSHGLLNYSPTHLSLTPSGTLVLNSILTELVG